MTMHMYLLQHSYDLEDCTETKVIGIYSTRDEAERAVQRLLTQPGFRDRPSDFHIDDYPLDEDHWAEGFVTVS